MSEDGDGVPFFAFFAQHNYAPPTVATPPTTAVAPGG